MDGNPRVTDPSTGLPVFKELVWFEKSHWSIPKNTSWDILFLRLEGTYLPTQGGVFDGGYYTLLCVKAKLFRTP